MLLQVHSTGTTAVWDVPWDAYPQLWRTRELSVLDPSTSETAWLTFRWAWRWTTGAHSPCALYAELQTNRVPKTMAGLPAALLRSSRIQGEEKKKVWKKIVKRGWSNNGRQRKKQSRKRNESTSTPRDVSSNFLAVVAYTRTMSEKTRDHLYRRVNHVKHNRIFTVGHFSSNNSVRSSAKK